MSEAQPTPKAPKRHAVRWLAGVFIALLLLFVTTAAVIAWAATTARGSAWALSLVPGLQVQGGQGAIWGDYSAERVVLRLPNLDAKNAPSKTDHVITLHNVGWRGVGFERTSMRTSTPPETPLWGQITLNTLRAQRIDVQLAASANPKPPQPPAHLRLPLAVHVRAVRVDEVYISALGAEPLRDVTASVHVGAESGAQHQVDQLSLSWHQVQLRGLARISTDAAMTLYALVGLGGAPITPGALPWSASAALTGPLIQPLLQVNVQAQPPKSAPQTLTARATLRPFAAWPLGELTAQSLSLDLSVFHPAAPVTALNLQATARSTAANEPAQLHMRLTNAQAGRWSDQRLPVRELKLTAAARPDQPKVLQFNNIWVDVGSVAASGGVLKSEGRWSPEGWAFNAQLDALQPALLDARAPTMQLSGPIAVAGGPLATSPVHLKASLKSAANARVSPHLTVQTPAQLELDASLSPERLELRQLLAQAGGARASITGGARASITSGARASISGSAAQATPSVPWVVQLTPELVDFDPSVWWPGEANSAWRNSRHRLNAKGRVNLTVPSAPAPWPQTLAAVAGEATLQITPSLLAGVPLSGNAQLRSTPGQPLQVQLALDADGNQLKLSGAFNPTADKARADAWDVNLNAPELAKLAPLFKLIQPNQPATTGALTAQARATGRWPAVQTTGQLEGNALRGGPLSLQKITLDWSLGTSAAAAFTAQGRVTQAAWQPAGSAAAQQLESAELQLSGTGRAHSLSLRAASNARPPAWVASLLGRAAPTTVVTTAATTASLQAQGGFIESPEITGWRGTVQQLEARTTAATPLLRIQDVTTEASWGPGPARASIQPGQADVLGATVKWSRLAWQAATQPGALAQIDVDAQLEPLRAAPILAKLQPSFGWGGDLTLQAHVKLRSAPTFSADIVLERANGDLTVTEELGTRALDLTDLRVSLAADNGTWSFTQGLAGKTLGVLAGAVVARTSPLATWPPPDAPIQGVLELRVADLGTWGTWVPPGWRLGGTLHSSASIGGRFGAPEYTGQIDGDNLGIRNFVQGVNVTDGEALIRLQGTTAKIEKFSANAGGGTARLEGSASLGAAPSALLKLTADQFQLLGRVDRRLITSGTGQLQLDRQSLNFTGQFKVDEGLIDFSRGDAPTLSSDVTVLRASASATPAPAVEEPAPTPPSNRAISLDLRVNLGDQLRLRGRGLDTALGGELRITSPAGKLAVNGVVRAINGTYAAYGQKLTIDRSVIVFSGDVANPRLDIEATRPNTDLRVGVAVSGSASNPYVRLFSEPPLSDLDKLSWLVMGRGSDGLGRTETAIVQRAALALLAGEGGSLTDQLTKAIGLDEVSVRQSDGEVRDTVISVGKQVSRRLYLGYERGLNATTGSFQLIYRIAQRFTLRAQSGLDNSLDVIWVWRWE
jgi:translocation and assembly module TamB